MTPLYPQSARTHARTLARSLAQWNVTCVALLLPLRLLHSSSHYCPSPAVSGNRLQQLPASIGTLEKLEHLVVSSNEITSLPSEMARLARCASKTACLRWSNKLRRHMSDRLPMRCLSMPRALSAVCMHRNNRRTDAVATCVFGCCGNSLCGVASDGICSLRSQLLAFGDFESTRTSSDGWSPGWWIC